MITALQTRVGDVPYALIVLLYASMILVGGVGNLLVILVVVRNAAMRTARNVFIVNLAVSDLMLCLITMPLTLVEILYQTWQVSNFLLKLQAVSWAVFGYHLYWALGLQ